MMSWCTCTLFIAGCLYTGLRKLMCIYVLVRLYVCVCFLCIFIAASGFMLEDFIVGIAMWRRRYYEYKCTDSQKQQQ